MAYPWEMDRHSFGTFLSCTMCAFIAIFVSVMTASVVKIMANDYHISMLESLWLAETTAISTVVFSIFTIAVSDKIGKKRTVDLGMLIIIVSSVSSAFSGSFMMIILSRIICGAGCAFVFSANVSILTDVTKKEYLPEVMSFNHLATSLGGACGPIVGLAIAQAFGMTVLFLSIIPVCVIAILLLIRTDNVVVNAERKIDYPSQVLLIASLFCVLTGLIGPSWEFRLLCIAGIVFFVIFLIVQKRSEIKILNAHIFKNKTFRTAVILGLLFSVSMYAADNTFSYYLQLVDKDLVFFDIAVISTVSVAAYIKGMKPIVQMIASPVVARLCRGKNLNKLSVLGFILLLSAFVFMMTSRFVDTDECLIICLMVSGFMLALGNSVFKPANKSTMMSSVTKEERNSASAVTSIVDNFSKIGGVLLIANLMLIMGDTSEGTMESCLLITMFMILILSVIGMIISIKRIHVGYEKKVSD